MCQKILGSGDEKLSNKVSVFKEFTSTRQKINKQITNCCNVIAVSVKTKNKAWNSHG